MSFIPSPSKSGGRTEADATPQAMGLAMNGYEIRNALEFLAPERTPEQMRHRLVIELHSEAQEIRCPESGLYARHERLPEDIAIYLVDHEPAQVLPTQGMAPYDENDPDLPSEPIHIPSLVINGYQLQNALEFLAPDGTPEQLEYTLVIEHTERDLVFPEAGLYAYHDECPEEGAILLSDLELEGQADSGPEIYSEVTNSDAKPAADVQEQVTLPRDLAVRFASLVHTEDDVKALHALLERREIKLYAASGATSEELLTLDKQCREDVARAMGLTPSEDRGFAWSFLLAAIKKLSGTLVLESIKTAAEAANAQQAVQDGIDPSGTSSPV